MDIKPLISVVVPVYKVEKYLDRCIQSIQQQTYENIEIILVDDGSPDNCGKICDEYASKDKRIKVLHKENGGLSDARNKGMENTFGEFISFIDSDDYISPDMLQILYDNIQQKEADMALCNYWYVDEDGIKMEEINRDMPIKNEVMTNKEALQKLITEKNWYYVTVWNKLYRRNLLENFKFPMGKCHEDEFVIHELFGRCNRIVSIKSALYYYVQRESSIMGDEFCLKRLDCVEAFIDRTKFASEMGMGELAIGSLKRSRDKMVEGYQKLDMREQAVAQRMKQLKKEFNKCYQEVSLNVGFKQRIAFAIFRINIGLYSNIWNIAKNLGI